LDKKKLTFIVFLEKRNQIENINSKSARRGSDKHRNKERSEP
jgi:hypothetical protein